MGRIGRMGLLVVAMAVAVIAATGLLLAPYLERSTLEQGGQGHPLDGIGGPFALVNQRGEPVSNQSIRGKATLIFFGFTNCPDICPTSLFELTQRLKELGPEAERLNVLFVTVDPERDTQEQMALYLQSFDPRIQGLTGAPQAVEAMVKAFRVYAKRVPLEGGGYTMDHTATLFGLDRMGRTRILIDSHDAPEAVRAKIRRLIAA